MLLLLLVVLVTPPACHAFLVGRLHHLQPHKSAGRLGQQPAAAPPPPRLQPLIEAVAAAAIPGGLGGVIDADDGGLAGKTGEDGDDDDGDSSSDVGDGPPVGGFGLTWYGAERYSQQPDFPVLFVATRNESYARETERHFSA